MTREYRISCSDGRHVHLKPSQPKAHEAATRLNEEIERDHLPAYRDCKPWRVESREVSEWREDER